MKKESVAVLVISLTSPLLVGVYIQDRLNEEFESELKTSEVLPKIFDEILRKYTIENLFFARGPGSFMSVKVTYIFLQTLTVALNVPLFATDEFAINNKSPKKAIGSL